MDPNYSERIIRCFKRMLKDMPFVVKKQKKQQKRLVFDEKLE